jgi:hypothetical protein
MATRRKQAVNAADVAPIATQQLIPSVKTWLTQYGQEVNEERSIPDFRDGLKPVHRRSLWAMQQVVTSQNRLIKSARVVGNTIGQLHPHGDTACLRGNTLVPLLSGTNVTIKELADKKSGPKWVLSYDEETKSLVPALAHSWRKAKVTRKMLRIHLTSGEVIEVTPEHKLISSDRGWQEAKDLSIGDTLIGGALIDTDGYKEVTLNTKFRKKVHMLVGDAKYGGREDDEVYHHIDENTQNNRPSNLQLLSRAEHAIAHEDNYLDGLSLGRKRMFAEDSSLRTAIRKKNSTLTKEVSAHHGILIALKAIRTLQASNIEVTEDNYEKLRPCVYNLTRLETLYKKGHSFDELCSLAKDFKLDTNKAKGFTSKIKKARKGTRVQVPSKSKDPNGLLYARLGSVLGKLLAIHGSLNSVDWDTYTAYVRREPSMSANFNRVAYSKPERLKSLFSINTVAELAAKIPTWCLNAVARLEYVTLEAKETFYDFTVDNYENMIVFSSNGQKSGNFLVVHNCYNAIVTLTTSFAPVIQGEGNWGTQIDSAAAYRYTNCNLTELGKLNFHHYFLPCADLIPNFDGSSKEPLVLPALLPQLLFNGSSGIGVGVTTSIPSFEPASVLKIMIRLLNGESLSTEDYAKGLKFQEVYGGQPIKSKENAEAIRAFFEGHKGYVDWNSEIEIDRDSKTVTILAFAPGISPLNFLENKVKPRDEVQNVSAGDVGMSFVIRCKKTLNYNDFDKFVLFLKKGLTCRNHYEVYVTERLLDEGSGDNYHVNFFAISIPNLIVRWLKWRCKLEARSLDFRIEKTQSQIAFTELMILACDNLQIIMDALRREDTADYIAKKLKISIEQANVILDRKVRNLSKLDNSKLRLRVKELKSLLASLKTKRKKPSIEVKAFLESTIDRFKLAEKWIGTRQYRLQAGTANVVYTDPLLDSQPSDLEAAP